METQAENEFPYRCLHCDYDLRGLSGDAVRCPECGNVTTRAEFNAHFSMRAVGALRLAFTGSFFLIPILMFATLFLFRPDVLAFAVPLCVFLALWFVRLWRFVRVVGWSWRCFFQYVELQIAVVLCIFVGLACIPVCVLLARFFIEWSMSLHFPDWLRFAGTTVLGLVGFLTSAAVVFGVVFVVFRWAVHARTQLMRTALGHMIRQSD